MRNSGPAIAMDSAGDFVVSWQSYSEDGSGWGIYAQRFSKSGARQGSEFRVNTYTTNMQQLSTVAMDAAGDFVVAWSSQGEDGSGYGIFAQRYNSAGATLGGEFRVNTYTTNGQKFAAAAMDAQGDFVITWTSYTEDGSSGGIYGQRYNATGVAQGSEFRVNTYTAGMQNLSSVSMDPTGDFVVTWASNGEDGSLYGVYTQYYSSSGTPVGGETRANTFATGNQGGLIISGLNSGAAGVALSTSGNFTIAWDSGSNEDGSSYGVYAQRFQISSTAPVLTTNFPTSPISTPWTTTFTDQSNALAIDPHVTILDADSLTIASATVTIASGYSTPQDNLLFTNQNGITGTFDPVAGA